MKRFLLFLTVVSIALFSCADESVKPEKSEVSFSFTITQADAESGRIQNELPPGTSLMVTIDTKSGNNVLSNHKIEIIQFGDGYTTEPLALPSGSYVLKDFILVNTSSQALYATPKKGSAFAKLVHHSLPYAFNVGASKVNTLDMEVIDVTTSKPEDFGYASFNIDVVRPLSISVFTLEEGGPALTAATAFILKGTDTLSTHALGAKVNTIPFKGDSKTQYTLVVRKEGYGVYSKLFSYDAMLAELDGKPLSITLSDQTSGRLSILTEWPTDEVSFNLGFTGNATVIVNWGDGSTETITSSTDVALSHNNFDDGYASVTITGDLDKIRSFEAVKNVSDVDFRDLPNLEKVLMANVHVYHLDFSENKNLKYVDIQGSQAATLAFPQTHNISHLNMSSVSLMFAEPEQLDSYINNIYYNAIHKGIVNGYFNMKFIRSHDYDSEDTGPVLPTSGGGYTLDDLSLTYGWTVAYGG